jgi:glycosyltransferase involved in cell wall biosynthesis
LSNSNLKSNSCAVIPFFNEKDFLLDVVTETLKYVDAVIAVDDGSIDGSAELVAEIKNVHLISLKKNFGKGYALQIGFVEAINKNYDSIVTLDADKQHDSILIPEFLLQLNSYDVVIGNRLNDLSEMPIQRIFSNKITSYLMSIKTGYKILDSQCGYRAYRNNVIRKVKTVSYGYEAESEMIIYAARNGFSIGFVEIPTIYGFEKSKMNPLSAISGFIKILFK